MSVYERWFYQHPAMFHFGLRSNKRAGGRQLFSKSGEGGNEEETIDTWLLWSGERHMLHLRWNQGTTIFDTLKGLTWCILVKLNQNIWSWNCITVKCPSEPKQWNLQQWPMSLLWEVSKMLDLFLSICFSTPAKELGPSSRQKFELPAQQIKFLGSVWQNLIGFSVDIIIWYQISVNVPSSVMR